VFSFGNGTASATALSATPAGWQTGYITLGGGLRRDFDALQLSEEERDRWRNALRGADGSAN